MKETKKVIILEHINSPVISQAIFILRDGDIKEFSALSEAERIVSEYIEKKTKRAKGRNYFYLSVAIMMVIATFLCLYFKF